MLTRDMVVRQRSDGHLCDVENTPSVVDSAFCIPSVMWIGTEEKNSRYIEAAKRNIEYLLKDSPKTEDGVVFHMKGLREIWADSAGYFPYTCALMGYPEKGIQQMFGIMSYLRDPETGLFIQRRNTDTGECIYGLWSIGIGWIATGLIRLYDCLERYSEKFDKERTCIADAYRDLIIRILKYETPDHYFHNIINDPRTFTETEAGEMYAYSIYKAILNGVLPDLYRKKADELREAAEKRVDKNGLVQLSAGSPDFLKPGTSTESQAHFIMMECAYKNINA